MITIVIIIISIIIIIIIIIFKNNNMVIGISPSGRGNSCSSVADRVGCFTLTMSKYLYPKVYYGSNPIPLHCSLLPSINNCIPIDIVLEQRCAKFIWSCLNSYNTIYCIIRYFQW